MMECGYGITNSRSWLDPSVWRYQDCGYVTRAMQTNGYWFSVFPMASWGWSWIESVLDWLSTIEFICALGTYGIGGTIRAARKEQSATDAERALRGGMGTIWGWRVIWGQREVKGLSVRAARRGNLPLMGKSISVQRFGMNRIELPEGGN